MTAETRGRDLNTIKGLSQIRRLPRLGKIRLGIKAGKGDSTYPRETDYFVCPVEVQRQFGLEPKELDIIFPVDDELQVFPQSYKWYSFSSLRCKGNGDIAQRKVRDLSPEQKAALGDDIPDDQYEMVEVSCPCPLLDPDEKGKSQCNQVGSLSFMLPKVSLAGVYQIDTRSTTSIVNINSALSLARGLVGRIAMIPFKLRRMPQKIEYEGKMQTHWILVLEHQLTQEQIQKVRGEKLLLGDASLTSREPSGVQPHNFTEEPGSRGGIVEDVTPGQGEEREPAEIELKLTGVVKKEDYFIVRGKESEDGVELSFKTNDIELAKSASVFLKDNQRVAIWYRVDKDGKFVMTKIDKEIPF